MAKVQAVSFDLAGTIIFAHPSVGKIYAQAASQHGVIVNGVELETQFQLALRGTPKQKNPTNYWREIVLRTFGSQLPSAKFELVFEACWNAFAEEKAWRLAPGTVNTLTALRFLGIKLAILSNADSRMHRVLEGKKLSGVFDAVLLSQETGLSKPEPAAFQLVAQKLQVATSALIHIGDDPKDDGEGARDAGATGVIVGGAYAPESCLRAEKMSDVPYLIRALITEGQAKGKFSRHVLNLIANLRGLPEDHSRSSQRPVKTLDEAVQEAFKKLRLDQPVPEDAIFAHWASLLPPKLAKRCAPLRVVNETKLIIQCENSVIKSEVKFLERALLGKIRTLPACGKIQSLSLVTA
jgi:putative hydrolase of the HAD superfamily